MWRTVVNRISQWPTFILLSLAFIPYLAQWFAYDFLNDDAFISFRYSYNWAQFGEIVYNLGDRVEGFTNFLWVAIGAFVIWLG
jgi:membrane-associated phospholipid phosphatase